MAGWITQLQKKPRAARQRYAYGGAFVITGLIVGIWMTTQSVPTLEPVAAASDESSGAFSRFFTTIKGQSAAAVASFKGEVPEATTAPDTPATTNASSTANITLPDLTAETRAAAALKRSNASTSTTTAATTTSSTSPRAVMIATSSPKTAE